MKLGLAKDGNKNEDSLDIYDSEKKKKFAVDDIYELEEKPKTLDQGINISLKPGFNQKINSKVAPSKPLIEGTPKSTQKLT